MSRVQLGNAVFKAARPTPVDLKECGHRGRCPSIIFCAEPREPKSFCARCMKSCRWHDDRESTFYFLYNVDMQCITVFKIPLDLYESI